MMLMDSMIMDAFVIYCDVSRRLHKPGKRTGGTGSKFWENTEEEAG